MATEARETGNGGNPGDWRRLLKAHYVKVIPKLVGQFWKVYAEEAALDPTKAARVVGYRFPNTQGPRLVKKFGDVAEAARLTWIESCGVKPDELLRHLSEIVRDPDHKDRMKAIELNAKVHGMLSEKIIHDFDRQSLMRQIDARISQLVQARALDSGQDIGTVDDTDQEPE
jgi:hypothetical protein